MKNTHDGRSHDIVISGISGRFPQCNNVDEYRQKLLEGIDLVTNKNQRWPPGLYGLPQRAGNIPNLSHFDAKFFGIPSKQAHPMDPQQRISLEVAYEAIIDAGINPVEIWGSNIGVYVAISTGEAEEYSRCDIDSIDCYGLIGSFNALLPNRISYAFNLKGPSCVIDTACSSSLYALHQAVRDIQLGDCDAAIVVGSHLCLCPKINLQLYKGTMVGKSGTCHAFDSSADGYVRSESICAIYIQKASVARRIYANILGTKVNNDGRKKEGILCPSGESQYTLAKSLYEEIGIDPSEVVYVEAHGTGTRTGDPIELNAITDLYCKNRKKPLLVGSVKSNIGHTEPASGLCALAKLIIAMEVGVIPANLHYKDPNPNIPGLLDGRLKVVVTNEPLEQNAIIGINSFGVGGTNAHAILSCNKKSKSLIPTHILPRLVILSGRTEEAVNYFLNKATENHDDAEFLALLDSIHKQRIHGHEYRGYILGRTARKVGKVSGTKRPIWFVFSGLGSQWAGMAKHMMQYEVFRESIKRSACTLSVFGVQLEELLESGNEDTITNVLVCITAVQIALVDMLNKLEIKPDGMIGHSLGETACAYADGCLSAEQTILSSYWRGRAIIETPGTGTMACIHLSWEECKKYCSPDILPACFNAPNNVTVSGPTPEIHKLIETLKQKHVFANIIKGSKQAYHSKYIAEAGPKLKGFLEKVILSPKERSSKWISTSILEENWRPDSKKLCAAEYFANNLVSPVYFHQALWHIPDNAIVIEVAPRGLMQSILESNLAPAVTYVCPMQRGHLDNARFFLTQIGKLYIAGGQPNAGCLYKEVSFPVGRGTPMISPCIKWDHSVEWKVPYYSDSSSKMCGTSFTVDLCKEDDSYLSGHLLGGRIIYPVAGYLVMVWKAFAKLRQMDFEQLPVLFKNVKFHTTIVLDTTNPTRFSINILENLGVFEVASDDALVVSGNISLVNDVNMHIYQVNECADLDSLPLTSNDVYQEMQLRGYTYSGEFCTIKECNIQRSKAKVQWKKNWVTYIDGLLQFALLGSDERTLTLPDAIQQIIIDPTSVNETVYAHDDIITSGRIELSHIKVKPLLIEKGDDSSPILGVHQFVPLFNVSKNALRNTVGLILENLSDIKAVEITNKNCLATSIVSMIDDCQVNIQYTVINPRGQDVELLQTNGIECLSRNIEDYSFEEGTNLVVLSASYISTEYELSERLVRESGGFLLLEDFEQETSTRSEDNILETVSEQICTETNVRYRILRKPQIISLESIVISVTSDYILFNDSLKDALKRDAKIYLVTQSSVPTGLIGLVKCLRKKPGGNRIRSFYLHSNSHPFSLCSAFYASQLSKDLVQNVLSHENVWGSYRHVPFEEVSSDIMAEKADLSGFKWVKGGSINSKCENGEACTVYYATLNTNGFGFSGYNSVGERVMGVTSMSNLSTHIVVNAQNLYSVPNGWTLEDAATVCYAYEIAYYSLIIRGQLQRSETILIHKAVGSISLASVAIALHYDCNVFITVEDQHTKILLKDKYQVDDEHIGLLEDLCFVKRISKLIKNGVDLVLSAADGDVLLPLIYASKSCRFLQLARTNQVYENCRNATFHNIDIGCMNEREQIRALMRDGLRSGVISPLPRKVFAYDQIEEALECISKDMVLVQVRDNPECTLFPVSKSFINSEDVYVLSVGSSGFGLELPNWLVHNNARKLVLASPSGTTPGYLALQSKRWEKLGVKFLVATADAITTQSARKLLLEASALGAIGGIFCLPENVSTCSSLDKASREIQERLDYFVVFSSITTGDPEYSFVTSTADRICEARLSEGLPGLSIHWGAATDFSAFPENRIITQSISSCFVTLEKFLKQLHPVVTSTVWATQRTNTKTQSEFSILDFTTTLLSIDDIESVPQDITLSELGMDSLMGYEAKHALEAHYGLNLLASELRYLTIQGLLDLSSRTRVNNPLKKNQNDFEMTFEIMPENVLVKLQNGEGNPVFFIHPIQGSVTVLETLAKFVKPPVYGLQHAENCNASSINELAQFYINEVKKVQTKGPYLILGYSFGACVCFEMGLILESHNETVNLILLDGSHTTTAGQYIKHNSNYNSMWVTYFSSAFKQYSNPQVRISFYAQVDYKILKAKLESYQNEEEKYAFIAQAFTRIMPHPYDEILKSVKAFCSRMFAGVNYVPSTRFKGDAVLIRNKQDPLMEENDYGLNLVCEKNVEVYTTNGNHFTMIAGSCAPKIADIVHNVIEKLRKI